MFYGLAENQDFWKERLNLYVALAPVTRLDHAKSELIVFFSKFYKEIQSAAKLLHVWDILGSPAHYASKLICTVIPDLCLIGERFLITQDPSLDDKDRF